MSKKMLIDARHPEETRVALLSGGKVEDFDFESLSRKPLRGNIYLARITRVEPSLQAAFVEYGGNRHGFLAFGEIHPDYYQIPVADREVLRQAEALEAELAAKLAALDADADEVEDDSIEDDEDGASVASSSDDDESASEARADSEDDDARPRRGRGRRRRGGRGRRGRGRSSDDNENNSDEAEARSPSDDDDDNADNSSENDAVDAAEAVTDESPAEDASKDDVQPDEDLGWHGTDEDVIEALTHEEDAPDADASSDDDTDDEDGPKSIALSARTEPQLTEELPAEDADDASDEDDDAPAAELDEEQADDDDTAEAEDDTASADDSDVEAADEDTDESGDDAESRAEPEEEKAPREPTEEELAARQRAEEIADLQRRYDEARRERDRLLKNYRIQEVIKRRQIMLVQVVKEERGNKGAALTTYLSLAGRYGVLMPNNSRGGGVSRKISNQSDRRRLRKAIASLDVPHGQGLIIRTAGAKRTKAEIKRDYDYLARLWDTIREQTLKSVAPCCIYEEASLIKRAIRDLYDKDTSEILVEGEEGYREAKDFMKMLMPSHAKNVQPYREKEPLFLRHGVERQLDEMYQPVVNLKSGGYLVIQQTEALISVDVNSGKATKERNVEATALKTNSEAAVELARQCRLRDLAGLIVVDFIDMDENRNNRSVEKKFKDALKHDRARIQVGSISNFGLLEMSRQRRRSGIVDGTTRLCPVCDGSGFVRSVEMAALRILRSIEEKAVSDRAAQVTATTALDVALYILNQKRGWLNRIEDSYGVTIEINGDHEKTGDQYEVQTSGKARDVDTLRQSAAVEIGDVTVEHESDEDDTAEADNNVEADDDRQDNDESRADSDDDKPKKKRRRRRRRKSDSDDDDSARADGEDETSSSDEDGESEARSDDADDDTDSDGEPKRKRRRGRRGGRGRKSEQADASDETSSDEDGKAEKADADTAKADDANAVTEEVTESAEPVTAQEEAEPEPTPEPAPPRAAASIHEPLPEDDKKDDKAPKRGGWWQRAFGNGD
ncbi:Rne/Rng family ribonuclease [Parvularcula marina]|uniref:Rne/Rng family ribonuclease n=1 Tax=Parvularcula marina TaxID=2292771 RepID=UPI003510D679